MAEFVDPPPLRPGDRIALVAPSRPMEDGKLTIARDRLRDAFDLNPVVFETAERDWDWLGYDRPHDEITEQIDRYNPDATAVFNVDFGHTDPRLPLPIGGEARLDPPKETIAFE